MRVERIGPGADDRRMADACRGELEEARVTRRARRCRPDHLDPQPRAGARGRRPARDFDREVVRAAQEPDDDHIAERSTNGRAFRASSRQTGVARWAGERRPAPASDAEGPGECPPDLRPPASSERQQRGAESMADWGDTPPTFDRSSEAWGSSGAAFTEEGDGGGEQYIELIGSNLWVAGTVDLGRFRRVSDFVNIVQGYMVIKDAIVLTRTGDATRLTIPELRVLPDDIAVVAQLGDDDRQHSSGATGMVIEKRRQRLVVLTRTHIIDGDVFIQGDSTIMSFVDATDPKFIPMSDVRVRWVSDRKLAARYPFALLQRNQILGVASEGIKLGGAEQTMRRAAMLKAQATAEVVVGDGLGDEVGSTVPVADGSADAAGSDDGDGTGEGEPAVEGS